MVSQPLPALTCIGSKAAMKCHNFQSVSHPKGHQNQPGQVQAALRLFDAVFAESLHSAGAPEGTGVG